MSEISPTAPSTLPPHKTPKMEPTLIPPSSSSDDDAHDSLLTLSFNQDGGCLAVGTAQGFRICNVSPYQETFRRNFSNGMNVHGHAGASGSGSDHTDDDDDDDDDDDSGGKGDNHQKANHGGSRGGGGGIGSIEMLFRCNLLALVGGGSSPQYPPNKVLIWDDHLGRPIGELSFRQRVLTVRLRRDRICVALRDRVYVYNFGNLALLDTIITGGEKNGLGLLCISTSTDSTGAGSGSGGNSARGEGVGSNGAADGDDGGMVLACPSVQRGQVRVELYGLRKTVLIDACESALAAMALTVDGSLLATASERGTLIRLFDTGKKSSLGSGGSDAQRPIQLPGTPLREFRRGVEHAKICSLAFSLDKVWLACASDRETVHIFRVNKDDEATSSTAAIVTADNGTRTSRSLKNTPPSQPSASKSSSSASSSLYSASSRFAKKILPSVLTKSPKKYLQGEQSFVQVRGGITHPQICAFVPDQLHTIAVAGLDDHGNGCLMLACFSEDVKGDGHGHLGTNYTPGRRHRIEASSTTTRLFKGEAKRIAFHRFFKKGVGKNRAKDIYGGDRQVILNEDNVGAGGEHMHDVHPSNVDQVDCGVRDITFGDDADGFGFVSFVTEGGGGGDGDGDVPLSQPVDQGSCTNNSGADQIEENSNPQLKQAADDASGAPSSQPVATRTEQATKESQDNS